VVYVEGEQEEPQFRLHSLDELRQLGVDSKYSGSFQLQMTNTSHRI